MNDRCVVCHEPSEDERCSHCGAAQAPGGYRVERLVAQTPHSRLYLARSPDGRHVALKELLFALVPGATELEAFEREARLLRELDHPRIPHFVASFQEGRGVNTRLYLAQEFVDGESLADRLKTRRFSEQEAKDVARQLLAILEDLHARVPAIIHRDVKPANVIRRSDGTLVLVDFGAARNLANDATHRATLVGTFGYMPPEQMGGTVDATADLYAVGATLLHLVTGKPPADLATPDGRLAIDARGLSPTFVSWLSKLTARTRADRYQSAREALLALDAPPLQPVLKEGSSAGVALAAGLAFVVLGVGAFVLTARPAGPPPVDTEVVRSESPPPEPTPAPAPTPAASTPVEMIGGTMKRTQSRPPEPMPGVDVVKLQRVQPKGQRAFFMTEDFGFDATVDIALPAREGCTEGPRVRLKRVEVDPEGARSGGVRVALSVDVTGTDQRCHAVKGAVKADGEATSFHLVQGTATVIYAVVKPMTSELGVAFDRTLDGFLIDLERRTAKPLHPR